MSDDIVDLADSSDDDSEVICLETPSPRTRSRINRKQRTQSSKDNGSNKTTKKRKPSLIDFTNEAGSSSEHVPKRNKLHTTRQKSSHHHAVHAVHAVSHSPPEQNNSKSPSRDSALLDTVIRRSEISYQDRAFEEARFADFKKKALLQKTAAAEAEKESRKVQAQSFLEHHAQSCRRRVNDFKAEALSLPKGAITLKIRFPNSSTSQLTLNQTSPMSAVFDFCDAELYFRGAAVNGLTPTEDDPIVADVAELLEIHKDNVNFDKLPARYVYQLRQRRGKWMTRPPSDSSTTIGSLGLKGRILLEMGVPNDTDSEKSPREYEWEKQFARLKSFRAKHGHTNIPASHKELGMW